MSLFNQDNRTKNVVRSSLVGVGCNVINILLAFVYRTIFLHLLSATYLGINGLFSNVLQVLSFADLGIATAVVYRIYEPISQKNIRKVGELMHFFKQVYLVVATVIFLAGMSLIPFLEYFIKDTRDIPADVNLQVVYILFLLQTVASYVCSHKHMLVFADQRQYILSLLSTATRILCHALEVAILLLWRDFTASLCVSIVVTIAINMGLSMWITKKYRPVFEVKSKLPKEVRREIYRDTKATMLHKVGATVLNSTDNILVSRFVGLTVTGLYSNYAMILQGLNSMLGQLLGGFTSSLGNAHVELSKKNEYISYKRMLFLNLWIAGLATACLYSVVDEFVVIWIGENMLLDHLTVMVLCVQFFCGATRKINTSYIDACGLFVKDRGRPLIEAGINLVVSLVLVQRIGLAGVFIGTIVSHFCTVFWREPYILYRYAFKKKMTEYWTLYCSFGLLTVGAAYGMTVWKNYVLRWEPTLFHWFVQAFVCFCMFNGLAVFVYWRSAEFRFFAEVLKEKTCKR